MMCYTDTVVDICQLQNVEVEVEVGCLHITSGRHVSVTQPLHMLKLKLKLGTQHIFSGRDSIVHITSGRHSYV